jgi:hypothetical protein
MAAQNGAQHQPKISPGQGFHRSVSTPAPASSSSARIGALQQQQSVQMNPSVESQQQQAHRMDPLAVSGNPNHRVGLSRSLSRTEAVKE